VIRVLVVEDEPVAAEAHRAYVDRTPGFTTTAIAGTGAAALDALARQPVDLVLLDMNLPDAHGIDLCRRIRGAGAQVDVLAVTSARELATVRAAAAHGVVGYLLKPFTYPALRDRLAAYAEYRERLHGGGDAAGRTTSTVCSAGCARPGPRRCPRAWAGRPSTPSSPPSAPPARGCRPRRPPS
jgi:response regulator of citrate/malate metabolism